MQSLDRRDQLSGYRFLGYISGSPGFDCGEDVFLIQLKRLAYGLGDGVEGIKLPVGLNYPLLQALLLRYVPHQLDDGGGAPLAIGER